MKIAVIGALPHELKPLLKHVKAQRQLRAHAFPTAHPKLHSKEAWYHATYLSHEIMIVATGIGIRNAEEAFTRVLDAFNPDFLLSIGFAGALYESARIGDLVMATSVSLISGNAIKTSQIPAERGLHERLGGRGNIQEGSFFTLERLMEKEAVRLLLPSDVAFPVCEMETFPLAVLARQRQLPFLAVRAITDRADEEIPPEFVELADSSGWQQFMRAAGLLLSKPRLIPAAAKFATRSHKASEAVWLAFDTLAQAL